MSQSVSRKIIDRGGESFFIGYWVDADGIINIKNSGIFRLTFDKPSVFRGGLLVPDYEVTEQLPIQPGTRAKLEFRDVEGVDGTFEQAPVLKLIPPR